MDGDKIEHIVSHYRGTTRKSVDGHHNFVQDVYSKGIVSRGVRLGKAQIVNDVRFDSDYTLGVDDDLDFTLSEMVVPVIVDGKVVAAINVENNIVNAFSDDDLQLVEIVAMHVAANFRNRKFELVCPTSKFLTQKML